MKLVMCEGPNELAVVNILLDSNKLTFSQDELLGLRPFHARQITGSAIVRTELDLYPGRVDVLRIGDTLTDKLTIPQDYSDKIASETRYCTKPELEILLILAEGLEHEFDKVRAGRNRQSPKEFAKEHIRLGHKRYNNSTKFYKDYFGPQPEVLVQAIRKYQHTYRSHRTGERYVAELLR